jgi:hypothetical protein
MEDSIVKIAERGGPYDLATQDLRERFKAEAVMTIVLAGLDGTGFSASMPEDLKPFLPGLFRSIAAEIEDALAREQIAMICPACNTPLAFDPRHPLSPQNKPKAGSITVCAHCASFLTLDDRWRLLSEEELADLNDEVRIRLNRARRAIEERRRSLS